MASDSWRIDRPNASPGLYQERGKRDRNQEPNRYGKQDKAEHLWKGYPGSTVSRELLSFRYPPCMQSIAVYCASSCSLDPCFSQAARTLGAALAQEKISLVYGGGSTGLMGELANACKDAGGHVIGIITEYLKEREVAFARADELVVVDTMRERKKLMAHRADGFMMLPGGLGTWEEFFEVLVGRVIAEHAKPIGIVNDHRYFDPLLAMIDHGVEHAFIKPAARDLLVVGEDPVEVLDQLGRVDPHAISAQDLIPPLQSND